MSGLVNVRGARSGIIGTTEGTTVAGEGMNLVYNTSSTTDTHTGIFSTTYHTYTFIIGEQIPNTDNTGVYFQYLDGTNGTITANSYKGFAIGGEMTGDNAANSDEYRARWNQDKFDFFAGGGNPTNNSGYGGISGNFTIHMPFPSNRGIFMNGSFGHMRYQGTKTHTGSWFGHYGANISATGFKMWAGGGWASQRLYVYGHKT